MNGKPLILATNDDGIDALGLEALAKQSARLGEVLTCAPDSQKSACSHSLTISQPLRARKVEKNGAIFGYAINGTPSDCVKLAASRFATRKPDLVVSGVNHGQNTSINVMYSGTVAGAAEGMLLGIPSIAFSLANFDPEADMSVAEKYVYEIAKKTLAMEDFPKNTILNVNIPSLPAEEIKGVRVTRQSRNNWVDKYDARRDPFGREYFWFSGQYLENDFDASSDDAAVAAGYVSITPIKIDFSNFEAAKKIKFFEEEAP